MAAQASKRLLLRIGAILLLLFFSLEALAASVLRRGNISEPESLDPVIASTAPENNIVGDMFMGLTTEDAAARVIPGMAESWAASADGLVWTFKLRPGLKWSDGAPLKASDWVYSFRRLMDPRTAAKYASIEYAIKNAKAVNGGRLPVETLGVRAIDDRTLEITLEEQAPFFPGLMKHYTAFPVPAHVIAKLGDDWVKPGNLVSNGAFTVVEWKPHEYVKLVKNQHFFDAKNVKLDEIYYYPIEDEAVALTRFRAGGLDVNLGTRGFPIAQRDWLDKNRPGEAVISVNLANDYIVANMRRPPFNDLRLRRAISLCLDREALAEKIVRDGRLPAYAFVPPGIANYRNEARVDFADWPMDQRRAEARRLLAEAGYGPRTPLTFEYKYNMGTDSRRQAVAFAAFMKDCGMVVRLVGNELKIHYGSVYRADFEVAWVAWIADYNDPQNFLYTMESGAGIFNYPAYKSIAYDAFMAEAKATLDLDKRAGLLARAEQQLLDDVAIIPLAFTTSKELVSKRVRGFVPNAEDIHRSRWMSVDAE